MSGEGKTISEAAAITMSVGEILAHWDAIETWLQIDGHPDYEVSSWGRVRRGERIIKAVKTGRYWIVSLSTNGATSTARVHRLVIETFIGPPQFDGAIAAHNDGDTSNNRAVNLRWASALENQTDRIRHNTTTRGSEVFGAKLDEQAIPVIRERIANGERYPSIARDYGVSVSAISMIKLQRTWTHV